jgi:transcriptional regulator with XRE-family HTH domain
MCADFVSAKGARADIAQKLKSLRTRNGLTQPQAAERIGHKGLAVAFWEAGQEVPTEADLADIASAYRVQPAEIELLRTTIQRLRGVRQDPPELADAVQKAMPASLGHRGIFISYRRSDDPGFAGRLYDRLEAKFRRSQVFMDVDSIDLGVDFVEELDKALSSCAVLIAVTGPRWLTATAIDPSGQRRLDDPDNFVRLEIERALKRNIRVIPILVDGAQMLRRQDLPESLAPLVRRNGHTMTNARFGSDILELVSTLERILAT